MTHDVTRSRIDDPDLRRRVEAAAIQVVAYMNRGRKTVGGAYYASQGAPAPARSPEYSPLRRFDEAD